MRHHRIEIDRLDASELIEQLQRLQEGQDAILAHLSALTKDMGTVNLSGEDCYLDTRQFMKRAKISRSTAQRMRQRGEVKCKKVGRCYRFDWCDFNTQRLE